MAFFTNLQHDNPIGSPLLGRCLKYYDMLVAAQDFSEERYQQDGSFPGIYEWPAESLKPLNCIESDDATSFIQQHSTPLIQPDFARNSPIPVGITEKSKVPNKRPLGRNQSRKLKSVAGEILEDLSDKSVRDKSMSEVFVIVKKEGKDVRVNALTIDQELEAKIRAYNMLGVPTKYSSRVNSSGFGFPEQRFDRMKAPYQETFASVACSPGYYVLGVTSPPTLPDTSVCPQSPAGTLRPKVGELWAYTDSPFRTLSPTAKAKDNAVPGPGSYDPSYSLIDPRPLAANLWSPVRVDVPASAGQPLETLDPDAELAAPPLPRAAAVAHPHPLEGNANLPNECRQCDVCGSRAPNNIASMGCVRCGARTRKYGGRDVGVLTGAIPTSACRATARALPLQRPHAPPTPPLPLWLLVSTPQQPTGLPARASLVAAMPPQTPRRKLPRRR
jgi:hypothetical protein